MSNAVWPASCDCTEKHPPNPHISSTSLTFWRVLSATASGVHLLRICSELHQKLNSKNVSKSRRLRRDQTLERPLSETLMQYVHAYSQVTFIIGSMTTVQLVKVHRASKTNPPTSINGVMPEALARKLTSKLCLREDLPDPWLFPGRHVPKKKTGPSALLESTTWGQQLTNTQMLSHHAAMHQIDSH